MSEEPKPRKKGMARKLVYEKDNFNSFSSWQDYLYLAKEADGTFAFFGEKHCADWGDESPLRTKIGGITTPAEFVEKYEEIYHWLESDDLTVQDCLPVLKKLDRKFFRDVLPELVDQELINQDEMDEFLEP